VPWFIVTQTGIGWFRSAIGSTGPPRGSRGLPRRGQVAADGERGAPPEDGGANETLRADRNGSVGTYHPVAGPRELVTPRITTEETLRLFRPPPPSCPATAGREKGCKFQARNPSEATPAPITPASRSSQLASIVDRREGEDRPTRMCADKLVQMGGKVLTALADRRPNPRVSSPRKRGPTSRSAQAVRWVPAFAGMTLVGVGASVGHLPRFAGEDG